MKKPIIAVDIDDVLSDSASEFVAYSNRTHGTSLSIDDYTEHWGQLWNTPPEETERRARQFHKAGVVGTFKHHPTAIPVLKHLSKRYKLIITTARRKDLVPETTDWLTRHFGGIFEEVHYAGIWDKIHEETHSMTKAELCQEVGADFLIDDQLKHCVGAAEAGLECLLFGDYPWNQSDDLSPNIIRVNDWQAVKEYFDARQ